MQPSAPNAFAFGVMGDAPYSAAEEESFLTMLDRMNEEPLAFEVHVGDFKGGGACSDALYEKRKEQFNRSKHPLIYTPGDNEWTDCRYRSMGSMNPLERLARLRQVFFSDGWSLGQRRLETAFQSECVEGTAQDCRCPGHPENRAWTHSGVMFVTLNLPGSNNNTGFDAANDEEARCRNHANRAWLDRAIALGRAPGIRALVLLIQANPWAPESSSNPYAPFLDHFKRVARALGKPILFVHGDTHNFHVDWPLADASGVPIANVTRLETWGSPFVGWVKVSVDPDDPQPFRISGRLEALVCSSVHAIALLREVVRRSNTLAPRSDSPRR